MASGESTLRSLGVKYLRGPGRAKSFEPNISRYLKGRTSKMLWPYVRHHKIRNEMSKIIKKRLVKIIFNLLISVIIFSITLLNINKKFSVLRGVEQSRMVCDLSNSINRNYSGAPAGWNGADTPTRNI